MKQFSRSKINLACLSALTLLTLNTNTVFSQEQPSREIQEDEIEVIQVTGLRGSLLEAVNRKRFSEVISDSIVAEDIGKMPDRNIAEALQRITGVSIARDDGEGTSVSIRGITSNLNLTLINGQTVASAGDGRGIDFSSMPSSMISAVEVYKSPQARHLEGSIGGTINILTARPLDVGEAKGTAFVEAVYNENNEETSPAFTFSYMTPITDTFGIAAAVSHEEINTRTDSLNNWSWSDSETGYYPTRWNVQTSDRDSKRDSLLVNLQWQPADNIDTYMDVTYSKVTDVKDTHAFSTWIPYGYGAIVADSIVTNPNTNTMTEYIVDSLYVSPFDQNIEADIDTLTVQLGGEIELNNLTISAALGYSKAETEQLTQQIYNFDHWWFNGDQHDAKFIMGSDRQYGYFSAVDEGYTEFYDTNVLMNHPNETFEDDKGNLNRLSQGPVMRLPVTNTDEDMSFKIDVEYMLDNNTFISSFDAGIRWSERSKTTLTASQHLGPWEIAFEDGSLWGQEPLFHDVNAERYSPANFLGGNGSSGVPTSWNAIHDFDSSIASYAAHMNKLFGNTDDGNGPYFTDFDSIFNLMGVTPDRRGSADNIEETLAAYLQANLDLLDGDLTGNIGVRYVRTDLSSTGLSGDAYQAKHGGELTELNFTHDYDNVLPSINLSYKLTDDMVLRFAAATVISRPDFNQARAGGKAVTDGWMELDGSQDPNWGVEDEDRYSDGNVYLDPYKANQFDISYEYYFSETGMFSAGLFYKDITSYIFNKVILDGTVVEGSETEWKTRLPYYTEEDFDKGEVGVPDAIEYDLVFENYSKPINGDGGYISGVELGFLTTLEIIPGMENYGVQGNYTYADSSADYFKSSFDSEEIDLPYMNQSEHTYNIMGFYEGDDLMVRIAYNWRSESLENPSHDADGMAVWRDDYGQLDASFSYSLTDNVELVGSVSNLLEESSQQFKADRLDGNLLKGDAVPTDRSYYQGYNGRTFRLGVRATF